MRAIFVSAIGQKRTGNSLDDLIKYRQIRLNCISPKRKIFIIRSEQLAIPYKVFFSR